MKFRSAALPLPCSWIKGMIVIIQFAPEEFLYRESEIAHEMYFIISGSVEELSETKEVRSVLNRFLWIVYAKSCTYL